MKKKKRNVYFIVIALVLAFLLTYGFTYGKYVSNSIWNYYLSTRGFYFESDSLGMIPLKNVNNLWDGESVHFTIRNSANELAVTSYDISYQVVCTVKGEAASYTDCHINDEPSNVFDGTLFSYQGCVNETDDEVDVSTYNKSTCELNGYNWLNQVVTMDLYFDLILTDTNQTLDDVTVNISVTSTNPYSKTISGDFILHKRPNDDDKISLSYDKHSNYDKLIVTNSYDVNKCVKISWDSNKLLIDSNNLFYSNKVDENGYINEIVISIDAKKSKSYDFYKRDFNANYNVDEFSFIEVEECQID